MSITRITIKTMLSQRLLPPTHALGHLNLYEHRRLGGEIAVQRGPPAGKSSFEFVLAPRARARRSCVGGREEFTPLSLGVRQHKYFPLGPCQAGARIVPSVARRCPVGVPSGSC
eukprot:5284551-Pyramimonas_sp.AAC.1